MAERRRQKMVAQNMMWPATFLPFVYGLGFTPPQQKKNKCEKRTSKNDMEVDSADTETHVHDGAGSSGTGTEASGVTEQATSANAAAAAATDSPIDPFVEKYIKALAFGYEDAWPYSSFNRPGLIFNSKLNCNKET